MRSILLFKFTGVNNEIIATFCAAFLQITFILIFRGKKNNFFVVGDCKLKSQENMLTICRNSGYLLESLVTYPSVNSYY